MSRLLFGVLWRPFGGHFGISLEAFWKNKKTTQKQQQQQMYISRGNIEFAVLVLPPRLLMWLGLVQF
jgi:hypothetical protein